MSFGAVVGNEFALDNTRHVGCYGGPFLARNVPHWNVNEGVLLLYLEFSTPFFDLESFAGQKVVPNDSIHVFIPEVSEGDEIDPPVPERFYKSRIETVAGLPGGPIGPYSDLTWGFPTFGNQLGGTSARKLIGVWCHGELLVTLIGWGSHLLVVAVSGGLIICRIPVICVAELRITWLLLVRWERCSLVLNVVGNPRIEWRWL